jgi:uncharacterized repeat protein (TIGR03803 family)
LGLVEEIANMQNPAWSWIRCGNLLPIAALVAICAGGSARAGNYSVLYTFSCPQGLSCPDGATPSGLLLLGNDGTIYGTAYGGGDNNDGTVYELTSGNSFTLLHSFSGTDGAYPNSGVIKDAAGNLYGTTIQGGVNGGGVIFEIAGDGTESTLTNICTKKITNLCGSYGDAPGGLTQDSKGNLWGTTFYDGACLTGGTVLKLTTSRHLKEVYSFCGENGGDPDNNAANLLEGKGNKLYGTTLYGGANSWGTVFEISSSGNETILYNFCSEENCSDGAQPNAGLVADDAGNLYGTTNTGGDASSVCSKYNDVGCGTVFELSPPAKGQSQWTEKVLYAFSGGTDGDTPNAGLALDSSGDVYGTTNEGGSGGYCSSVRGSSSVCGTVFKVAPGGQETVLYNFCSEPYCEDGLTPSSGLVADANGNLYGTTTSGGAGEWGNGVIFTIPE